MLQTSKNMQMLSGSFSIGYASDNVPESNLMGYSN